MPTAKLSDIIPTSKTANAAPKANPGTPDGQGEILPGRTDGTRRVTGSADIPLNAEGKKQSKELAKEKATKPFDMVFTSPEKRAMQTAKEFGTPIKLSGLDAWRRGAAEGKAVDAVKNQVKVWMLNPDKRPPGNSPESGEPGESLNEFSKPLLATIRALNEIRPKDSRWLMVTHGGNLQCIDAWLKAGCPDDLGFDNRKMAQMPYWSVVGKLFKFDGKALGEVPNDDEPALYLLEHSSTDFNSSDSGSSDGETPKPPSAARAKPAAKETAAK